MVPKILRSALRVVLFSFFLRLSEAILVTSTVSSTPSTSSSVSPTASVLTVGFYSYYGCQTEGSAMRALASKSTAYDGMTLESCSADCAGYRYFGTEYGRECYCGVTFSAGSIAAPESDCTFPCGGNSIETCGAGSRLSVFEMTSDIISDTSSSTSSSSAIGSYAYYGCWTEGTNARALAAAMYASDGLTLEVCAEFCAGYTYWGVEYARECYCGNNFSQGSIPAVETDCSFGCMGDLNEICGAGSRLSVYSLISNGVAVSGTSYTSSSAVPSSTSLSTSSQSISSRSSGVNPSFLSSAFLTQPSYSSSSVKPISSTSTKSSSSSSVKSSSSFLTKSISPSSVKPTTVSSTKSTSSSSLKQTSSTSTKLTSSSFGIKTSSTSIKSTSLSSAKSSTSSSKSSTSSIHSSSISSTSSKISTLSTSKVSISSSSSKSSTSTVPSVSVSSTSSKSSTLFISTVLAPSSSSGSLAPSSISSGTTPTISTTFGAGASSSQSFSLFLAPTSSSTASTQATPTLGIVQTIGAYTFQGCYTEATNMRALTGTSFYAYIDMTLEECANSCTSWEYFGVEYGGECYCGNSLNPGSVIDDIANCGFICPGNSFEYCGAGGHLELYMNPTWTSALPSTLVTSATSSSSTSGSLPALDGWNYQGCYADVPDKRTMTFQENDNAAQTIEGCISDCGRQGYAIAGLEFGVQCFCSQQLHNGVTPQLDSNCNTKCGGNAGEMCGGPNFMSVYSVDPPEVLPLAVPQSTGLPGNWTYRGCIEDNINQQRTLPEQLNLDVNDAVNCIAGCQALNYTAAGLEYADQCFCGTLEDVAASGPVFQLEKECSAVCSGNSLYLCGASALLTYYTSS